MYVYSFAGLLISMFNNVSRREVIFNNNQVLERRETEVSKLKGGGILLLEIITLIIKNDNNVCNEILKLKLDLWIISVLY